VVEVGLGSRLSVALGAGAGAVAIDPDGVGAGVSDPVHAAVARVVSTTSAAARDRTGTAPQ
jgi:hypothetical protein